MAGYISKRKDFLTAIENINGYDVPLIKKALDFATENHDGQFRHSGEPYIEHPINVSVILVELGMDTESVIAGLLHDVIEDTEVTYEDVQKLFGNEVATLVDGVTKLGKIPYYSREEQQAENLRKMLLAMSEDVRVIIIKLADRLHNMRTISSHREQKRRDISLETIEVYAPIAHRLGIRGMKEELEDICLQQLDPIAYSDICSALEARDKDGKKFLQNKQDMIRERLEKDFHNIFIESRVKSIHGIYRKMYMQSKTFDEIYDVYAIRIIVETVNDCYNVLGLIHDMFRPIPGRFKDYISTPKQNHYQSLHTTVLDREGIPFEVQIRTWEMHRTAEYGIAAHWKYKVGVTGSNAKMDEQLSWIRQLLEAQRESGEAEELVTSIKTDLMTDEVFVLTPKGDVISLPVGATVIDFAYAIHSAVGNRMVGAKVNGRIVPIDYKVNNGEIIDVITTNQQGHGPARDWLNIVKTSEARSKIRSWFKKERRTENISEGKAAIEREMRRENLTMTEEQHKQFFDHFASLYHCNSLEDFYAAVGYGGILLARLIPRMRDEFNKNYKPVEAEINVSTYINNNTKPLNAPEGVVVEGVDNCLLKFSRCCGPLPGDEIIGFITRGHGVSIHKRDCPNVPRDISKSAEPDRWVRAYWTSSGGEYFKATLFILAINRDSLLADITSVLVNMRVALHNVNARELKDGNCQIIITISTEGKEHLSNIITKLGKISNVLTVDRTGV